MLRGGSNLFAEDSSNPYSLTTMPSVLIPTPLRKLTNDLDLVQAAGSNVGELLDNLDRAFPGLKERVCDEQGNVRRFVNVFVNGEDIRFLEEKATPVKEADEVSIVPAIAGG
jgi:molybdopterin synthase sulfur carrier subunit